ncbi:MAG: ethanolamine ammonia-lyase reactivating factor EutA [Gammaproteobacteria bacterium]|nr:ethanolamine ammonia-lyase reactivating factor EutA [Gammaproteobacteria bacterium]
MSATSTTFFSNHARTLDTEDEIVLTSVGVDIGSSTSHLVFSRIVMDRRDNRYVVTSREVLFESDVMLTPYKDDTTIDATRLQPFLESQYQRAGIHFDDVDAGALILTGVAVRRRNARAIGELFADQAGKFVAVSAGDSLETALVAYGSGAVALSTSESVPVMNVDIGGGTSKIALCVDGEIVDRTAIDVGARLICFDEQGRVSWIEEAGQKFADECGVPLSLGEVLAAEDQSIIVGRMVERLFQAMGAAPMDDTSRALLRLDPLSDERRPAIVSFSGGVSEYLYGAENSSFGDLGALLADSVRRRAENWGPELRAPLQGIRATVIGASQYTVQVSGSTIFVMPDETLPLRNIAVISPAVDLADDTLDAAVIAQQIKSSLRRMDLQDGRQTVAMCYEWGGSATYQRLDDFCRGVIEGLDAELERGAPLLLVSDSDVGGLVGLHCYEVLGLQNPVVSIDGIVVNEFDFIDIGSILDSSGAVPVVIKSLVFPAPAT